MPFTANCESAKGSQNSNRKHLSAFPPPSFPAVSVGSEGRTLHTDGLKSMKLKYGTAKRIITRRPPSLQTPTQRRVLPHSSQAEVVDPSQTCPSHLPPSSTTSSIPRCSQGRRPFQRSTLLRVSWAARGETVEEVRLYRRVKRARGGEGGAQTSRVWIETL